MILTRAVAIVDQRVERERQRGESAERRVGIVLVVVGVLAASLGILGERLVGRDSTALNFLSASLIVMSGAFVAKALYYSLRSLDVKQPNRLTHELAETIQLETLFLALRTEIAWKRWEIDESIDFNTQKLFWLARSQRNAIGAIFSFLALGFALTFQTLLPNVATILVGASVEVVGVFLLIGLDLLAERRSFWYWKTDSNSPG